MELYSYPWSVYYGNFTYGVGITLFFYLFPPVIAGVVVITALGIIGGFLRVSARNEALLTGLAVLAIFLCMDLMLGPLGVEIYHARVRGIFFDEWNFINFFVFVALPISIFVSGVTWLTARACRPRSTQSTSL